MPDHVGETSAQDGAASADLKALGERVGELVEALENHPDRTVGDQVEELLQAVDRLHRDALLRIAGLLAHHELLEHACADPVIGMVLDLYELTPEATADTVASRLSSGPPILARAQPPPAPDGAQALIRLEDIRRIPAAPALPPAGASPPAPRDPPARRAPSAEPEIARLEKSGWTELFTIDDLAPDSMGASGDGRILICNVGGVLHALRNRCGDSPLPLHLGELVDGRVMCPWHTPCAYDVATGESSSGRRTVVYPIAVEGTRIRVALDPATGAGSLQPDLRAAPR